MKTARHQIKGMLHILRNLNTVDYTLYKRNYGEHKNKSEHCSCRTNRPTFFLTNARQHIRLFCSIKWMEQNNVTNWSQQIQVTNCKSLLLSLNVTMQHK